MRSRLGGEMLSLSKADFEPDIRIVTKRARRQLPYERMEICHRHPEPRQQVFKESLSPGT